MNSKKGFTLFELLIVMLIMGLIYGLSISSMKKNDKEIDNLSLKNLNSFLLEYHNHNLVKIICLNECDECYLYVDEEIQEVEIEPFLDKECNIYEIDQFLGTKRVEFTPIFNEDRVEKDVCFEYSIDKYGGSKEFIVECKNDVTLLRNSSYIKETKFHSSDEALEYKEILLQKVNE